VNRILLMGNPNVGKSAVFSRLTGIQVVASNYPGTTVEFSQGYMGVGDDRVLLIDVPGTYGLEATSKAEKIAVSMLEAGDTVINVVDATNLERNLHLTLHLLEQDIRLVVALNIWDDAQHKGIHIDVAKLESELGVPVIPTVGVTGEGIKELVSRVREAANRGVPERTEEDRWTEVGRIADAVQSLEHRHHTGLEMLADASVRHLTGVPIALCVLLVAFAVIRLLGEGLIGYVLEPLFQVLWRPAVMALSSLLGPGSLLHSLLVGTLIDGQIDFLQSFGLVTTGLYVPIAMVLPYVLSFYLVLGFLEDFGYLPRLGVLLDSILHRMGIHGWAIIPNLLGLGCNVPGILATRVLESRRERLIVATVVSIGVPCASLQAMIVGLLGGMGIRYVAAVYLSLFAVWFLLGWFLNKVVRGESPELIMEMPPYRMPSWQALAKKLWMRMQGFVREAIPLVLLGVLVVNVLYFARVFDFVAQLASPVVTRLFGLPREAVVALAVGFLRKDVAVGLLGTMSLDAGQLVVAATVLSMFFPCVATFAVLWKELGPGDTARSVGAMLVSSLVVGGVLNALF